MLIENFNIKDEVKSRMERYKHDDHSSDEENC